MNQHENIQAIISQASEACLELTSLIEQENESLKARKISAVEENLKDKRRLIGRMESLMQKLRIFKNDPAIKSEKAQLQLLQNSIDEYHKQAEKNAYLLRAAHEGTAEFLRMVHSAMNKTSKNKVNTYGNDGTLSEKTGSSSIINKNI